MKNIGKKLVLFLTVLLLFYLIFSSFSSKIVFSQTDPQQEKEKLEKELSELEAQIAKLENAIGSTQQEIKTRQSQIGALKNRIKQLELQIRRTNLIIGDLDLQVKDTESSINDTLLKIEQEKQKLSRVIKAIYEEEQKSFLEVLISEKSLSGLFDTLATLDSLNKKKGEILNSVKKLKVDLEVQKDKLDKERQSLTIQVKAHNFEKEESETTRKEQEKLLKMSEAQYQEYVKQKKLTEQKAAEIKARLFQLAGVPDVEAPTFGEALQVAQWVQQHTGIRPSFLLSIITQESRLARNVGQCYLVDTTSGKTRHISTGTQYTRGIHPTRDLPIFLEITKQMNKDPLHTPVSCWIDVGRGKNFGWGGAIGPAQFLPSTWMKIVDRISSIMNNNSPNPWSVRDSFLAAGFLLRDLGGVSNESLAAARYFGASVPFPYSSQVMKRVDCIDAFLNNGTLSSQCEQLVFVP